MQKQHLQGLNVSVKTWKASHREVPPGGHTSCLVAAQQRCIHHRFTKLIEIYSV